MSRLLHAVAVVVALLLFGCNGQIANQGESADSYRSFSQAEAFLSDDFRQPAGDSAAWQQVALPDVWELSRPGVSGGVWYRIPVLIEGDATPPWGVLLPRFSMNAAVWWDGKLLGSGGSMQEPLARNWARPLYLTLPAEMTGEGMHWLHVYVRALAHDGAGLGKVYVGPDRFLKPLFERVDYLHITVGWIALVITLVIALVMGALWLLRKHHTELLWMAMTGIFWSLVIANQVITYPPVPHFYWEWMVFSSIGGFTVCLLIAVHRFMERASPNLERAIVTVYVLNSLLALIYSGDELVHWFNFFHIASLLLGIYMVALTLWHYRRTGMLMALWMGASILLATLFAAHDWWATLHAQHLSTLFVMQFGPPLMMLFIGGWMLSHVAASLKSEEQQKREAEEQVSLISARLKEESERRLELERKRILAEERQRFTRELHDGMGGHLVALKSMLSEEAEDGSAQVLKVVDQAILDMRLIIDAVGDECDDIGMILGLLRSRMEYELKAANLHVTWNMISLPVGCMLQEGSSIHLVRILQEAITNIIRHADADWVDIRATEVEHNGSPHVRIDVADNGAGIPEGGASGHGIGNMTRRCDLLDGFFSISNNPGGGTLVRITIPCRKQ